jgi:hypothetical protein
VETFAVPLLKTKDISASNLSNCEGSAKKQNFMVVGNTGLGVPHSGREKSVAGVEFLPPPDWARPVTCSAVKSFSGEFQTPSVRARRGGRLRLTAYLNRNVMRLSLGP